MFELTLKLAQGNLPPQLFRVRLQPATISPTHGFASGSWCRLIAQGMVYCMLLIYLAVVGAAHA